MRDIITPAACVRSIMAILPRIAVSFNKELNSLIKDGKEFLIACGITINFKVCALLNPKDMPASY